MRNRKLLITLTVNWYDVEAVLTPCDLEEIASILRSSESTDRVTHGLSEDEWDQVAERLMLTQNEHKIWVHKRKAKEVSCR